MRESSIVHKRRITQKRSCNMGSVHCDAQAQLCALHRCHLASFTQHKVVLRTYACTHRLYHVSPTLLSNGSKHTHAHAGACKFVLSVHVDVRISVRRMRSAVLLFAFTNTHNHSLRDGARTDTRGSSGSTLVTSANSPSCVRMHWHVSSRGM